MPKILLIDGSDFPEVYTDRYRVAKGEQGFAEVSAPGLTPYKIPLNREDVAKSPPLATIYCREQPVDGHWLVRIFYPDIFSKDTGIIGVTSHREDVSNKTYEKALEYAKQIAQQEGLELLDLTRRAKNKLEQKTQEGTHFIRGGENHFNDPYFIY